MSDQEGNSSQRKEDHIDLTNASQMPRETKDARFDYEPLFSGHPEGSADWPITLGGKKMSYPIWVSSMTGGSSKAGPINKNLARGCAKFGLGMGLGSCRTLLYSDDYLEDFNCRPLLGQELPLFANIGIAQLEQLHEDKAYDRIDAVVEKLDADGLVIHINPLQEYYQAEGDSLKRPPIETLRAFVARSEYPIIVKEVGQGFGPRSLKALLDLNLEAIEFGAYGGTNFSRLEALRRDESLTDDYLQLVQIGHTAPEMLQMVRDIVEKNTQKYNSKLIVSGGIKSFLDGYYCIANAPLPAMYGQASAMLKAAAKGEQALDKYISEQIQGLMMAKSFLRSKL